MFGNRTMSRLAARRQELLFQSEVNRRLLAVNFTELRAATAWVDVGVGFIQRVRPYAMVLAPILGFLVVRLWRRPGGIFGKLALVIRMFRKLRQFGQGFQTGS